jgi:serine/threonine protein kinase
LTGTRPPAAPLPRQPSTNGRQDQQQQPPPLQQQQQQQQQGLLVQEEAAALSSQARRWEARRKAREAAEAADKRLFSHGEELWLNMEGQHGTSKVQLQVDVYLGRGGYGVVYRVEEQVALTGAAAAIAAAGGQEANSAGQRLQRALKIVRPYELQQLVRGEEFKTTKADYLMECEADMQQEQKVLSKAADPVAHPCIVECYQRGWVEVRGHGFYPALLLEYCPGGSLEDLMRREGPQLSYERTRRFMIEVCYGVRFLHEIGIAHRDIKPANLLLTGMPGEEQVKLADLGCALEVTKARVCGQPVCTPAYRAPEMAENGWHDERVDSWLVGCLLLHLRSGKVPWHFLKEGEEGRRGAAQLDNPASPYYSELGLTDVEKKVLRDCLADQSFRPPVSELMLKHPKYFVLFSI